MKSLNNGSLSMTESILKQLSMEREKGISNKMFLKELLEKNGHKLVRHDNCIAGHKYESVFSYSERHGGTFDSFQYYNKYVVDITE